MKLPRLSYGLCLALILPPAWQSGDQEELLRTGFESPVSEIASWAKDSERDYREVEKKLRSLFDAASQRSPFYQSIESDYQAYRNSVTELREHATSLNKDHKSYLKLFSAGLLRSVEKLTPEDENWEEAENLARRFGENLENSRAEINRQEPLRESVFTFTERMDEVIEFGKELETDVDESGKESERSLSRSQKPLGKFRSMDDALARFPVYGKGDSIRLSLEQTHRHLRTMTDSLASLMSSLDYLLAGRAKSGDEERVWELYRSIVESEQTVTNEIVYLQESSESDREKLRDILELLDTFGELIGQMEDGVAEMARLQLESQSAAEACSLQYSGLLDAAPTGVSTEETPYRELRLAFQKCKTSVSSTGGLLEGVRQIQQRLITEAARMEKLGDRESDLLDRLEDEFDEGGEKAQELYGEFADVTEKFRDIIRTDFKHTAQYWELEYRFEEKKSSRGEKVFEENFGYLYDPNEYPDKPYHGRLTTTFQLRLRGGGEKKKTYYLILEGMTEFGIDGLVVLDDDSILYQISEEKVVEMDETVAEDGRVEFVWVLPVEDTLLQQIAHSGRALVKIHLFTLTHRINQTLYREKLFRIYEIPQVRLREWERWLRT